jgi:co-chaperonin GroES (HSP10)
MFKNTAPARLVVEILEEKKQAPTSGIVIPLADKETRIGRITVVGCEQGQNLTNQGYGFDEGDRVIFRKNCGIPFIHNNTEYIALDMKDVLASYEEV